MLPNIVKENKPKNYINYKIPLKRINKDTEVWYAPRWLPRCGIFVAAKKIVIQEDHW